MSSQYIQIHNTCCLQSLQIAFIGGDEDQAVSHGSDQGYPSGVIFALVLWFHLQKKNSPQTSRNCGQKEEQPWASPYSWHLKGCSSVWNLVLRFLFTIEYDIWCRAVLLFAQVPWIGTEILLLVTTISGLFFFLRWDQSTSSKMIPLVLPDGCSSIFLGCNPTPSCNSW